jgi:hypothetical protein
MHLGIDGRVDTGGRLVSAPEERGTSGHKNVNTFDLLITFGDFEVFVYADDGHPGPSWQRLSELQSLGDSNLISTSEIVGSYSGPEVWNHFNAGSGPAGTPTAKP